MIYDGTSAHANKDNSADRQLSSTSTFNSSWNDNVYVGYMYGSAGQTGENAYDNTHTNTNSSTVLDTWYNGLSSTNKEYIADRVLCGDRSLCSGTGFGDTITNMINIQ